MIHQIGEEEEEEEEQREGLIEGIMEMDIPIELPEIPASIFSSSSSPSSLSGGGNEEKGEEERKKNRIALIDETYSLPPLYHYSSPNLIDYFLSSLSSPSPYAHHQDNLTFSSSFLLPLHMRGFGVVNPIQPHRGGGGALDQDDQGRVMRGDRIYCGQFSEDGEYFVTGSQDEMVHICHSSDFIDPFSTNQPYQSIHDMSQGEVDRIKWQDDDDQEEEEKGDDLSDDNEEQVRNAMRTRSGNVYARRIASALGLFRNDFDEDDENNNEEEEGEGGGNGQPQEPRSSRRDEGERRRRLLKRGRNPGMRRKPHIGISPIKSVRVRNMVWTVTDTALSPDNNFLVYSTLRYFFYYDYKFCFCFLLFQFNSKFGECDWSV